MHEDFGPNPDEHMLIFKETELEDDYTLLDYNIRNEDILLSVPSGETRGGAIKFNSLNS